jgi:hypothetical protein
MEKFNGDLDGISTVKINRDGSLSIKDSLNGEFISFESGNDYKISQAMLTYLCKNCKSMQTFEFNAFINSGEKLVIEEFPKSLTVVTITPSGDGSLTVNSNLFKTLNELGTLHLLNVTIDGPLNGLPKSLTTVYIKDGHCKIDGNALKTLNQLYSLNLENVVIDGSLDNLPSSIEYLTLQPRNSMQIDMASLRNLPDIARLLLNENILVEGDNLADDFKFENLREVSFGPKVGSGFQQALKNLAQLEQVILVGSEWQEFPNWLADMPSVTQIDAGSLPAEVWKGEFQLPGTLGWLTISEEAYESDKEKITERLKSVTGKEINLNGKTLNGNIHITLLSPDAKA